jgi:hypothetical protein
MDLRGANSFQHFAHKSGLGNHHSQYTSFNMRPSLPALTLLLSNLSVSSGFCLRRSNPITSRSLSPFNNDVLVELTREILPEALKSPDGSVTSTKQVSSSIGRIFYNVSAMTESILDSDSRMLSHVIDSGWLR